MHPCAAGAKKAPPKTKRSGARAGGFSTQLHALTHALGNPLDFVLTPGQAADLQQAEALLPEAPVPAPIADQGYDADAFVETLATRQITLVIPPRSHRRAPREYDRYVYQERHLMECFFNKIQHDRRSFSRFEKTARHDMSFMRFVAVLIWLR